MDETEARLHVQSHLQRYTLSIEEAARVLAISPQLIWQHIRTGDLPHVWVQGAQGPEHRLVPEDVRALQGRMPVLVGQRAEQRDRPLIPPSPGTPAGQADAAPSTPRSVRGENEGTARSSAGAAPGESEGMAALHSLVAGLVESFSMANNRLIDENARLQDVARDLGDQLATLRAAGAVSQADQGAAAAHVQAQIDALASEHETWRGVLAGQPFEALHQHLGGLQEQLHALREEMLVVRSRQESTYTWEYENAWRQIQRRPWWALLPDGTGASAGENGLLS